MKVQNISRTSFQPRLPQTFRRQQSAVPLAPPAREIQVRPPERTRTQRSPDQAFGSSQRIAERYVRRVYLRIARDSLRKEGRHRRVAKHPGVHEDGANALGHQMYSRIA
jgi:hypothetical protein